MAWSSSSLYRRGPFLTALNRWIALGLGFLALCILVLRRPAAVRPLAAALVGLAYAGFALGASLWQRRRGASRGVKVAHDVADALAVGLGAAFTGGIESPVWLLFYPHVVAVSVRGGLAYALRIAVLDAGMVLALGAQSHASEFGALLAASLLWCGFMGGTVSSYLHATQARLHQLNLDLQAKNRELEGTLAAREESQREQRDAMDRLAQSEERYRKLLERLQDGVMIVTDGRIAYVNPAFARLVGDAPEGLVGADLRELVPEEDREDLQDRQRRWQEGPTVAGQLETRLRTRLGTTLLVSMRASAAEFQGQPALVTTVRDVTRERRMEREIRDHVGRLAAINEIASAVNQTLTVEDVFRVAAAEAHRVVGFDRLTVALLDEHSPGVELLAAGGRGQRAGFRSDEAAWAFRRPFAWHEGGEEPLPRFLHELLADREILAAATLPLVSKHRVIGALALGRRRAQPFAPAEIAAMEPVASHIGIAIDNARLLETVGRRGREFESLVEIGRRIVERLELDEILPLVARSVNRTMGTHFCLLMLRAGERLRVAAQEGLEPDVVASFEGMKVGDSLSGWVAREGCPLLVSDMLADPRLRNAETVRRYGYRSYLCVPMIRRGEVLGTLEVVTKEYRSFGAADQDLMTAFADQAAVAIEHARLFEQVRAQLRELGAANRRLQELDRLRQEYLRNVSHEFRTPLTVIRGYAEYLSSAEDLDGSVRDVMGIVIESCDRLIDLVETLIQVSRVEQGAAETLHVRALDLRQVALASYEGLRIAATKKGIEVRFELPEDALRVEGDQELLQQAVRKLLDNALKYSRPGGPVVLRLRGEGESALIEVEDRGIGIPPEHLDRIFEKFYMVDGSVTRRTGGSGVGLYLVREILRLHGGRVAVRSQPGAGSLFSVRLPRAFAGPTRAASVA